MRRIPFYIVCSLGLLCGCIFFVPNSGAQSSISPKRILDSALRKVASSAKDRDKTGAFRVSASTAKFSTVLSVSVPLAPRHALRISTEYVRLTSFYVKMNGFKENADWKFSAVPITLGYEYTLASEARRLVPVLGVGASAYFSRTKQLRAVDAGRMVSKYAGRFGVGYGAEASFGIRARLGRSLFLLTRGRYRIVNGFAFYGSNRKGARFPVLDFSVGFGLKL